MLSSSDPLFNEKAADAVVNRSLHNEITRLRRELQMSKVIKSVDGKYYTGEFEEVSAEQVTEMIAHKQTQLAELEAIAPAAEAPAAPAQPEQPTAPVDNPPAQPEQPVDQAAPAAPVAAPNDAAPAAPAVAEAPILQ